MELDPRTQQPMFEIATQGIEDFVPNLGRFTPFALAMLASGEIKILETSGEFEDGAAARQGLLDHLDSMRAQNQLIGCLVCSPVEVPSAGLQVAAVMEIEAEGTAPLRAVRQIINDANGPRLAAEVELMRGLARVFD